LNTWSSY